ncbi:MAG: Wadjet anti-phage system protein JetD domain-containing protein [Pseudomonadota bacterium]
MSWTTPTDLRTQLQKIWDKGQLLQPPEAGGTVFPLRLRFTVPSSTEMSARFDEVRSWMANLRQGSARLRFVQREFRHSILGYNSVPLEAWVDSLADALALIGKQKEAQRFAALQQLTMAQNPVLLPWLQKRPLNALALEAIWPRLLAVVSWLQNHKRPGIYLRQVDIEGIDSKFIETNRGVLAELFELALPPEAIDALAGGYSGLSQFCRRYGFKDKPLRIRFRLLDPALALIPLQPGQADQDIGVTQSLFEQLDLPVGRVFITENEVNFLAFPSVAGSLVIFGSGYGFDVLAGARWLQKCRIFYWGDIDTHGFAILDQLRTTLPQAESFLMDDQTLLAHALHWGEEPKTEGRDLPRLTLDEQGVYDSLRDHRIRPGLRLEQERIGFGWVQQALAALPDVDSPHD